MKVLSFKHLYLLNHIHYPTNDLSEISGISLISGSDIIGEISVLSLSGDSDIIFS